MIPDMSGMGTPLWRLSKGISRLKRNQPASLYQQLPTIFAHHKMHIPRTWHWAYKILTRETKLITIVMKFYWNSTLTRLHHGYAEMISLFPFIPRTLTKLILPQLDTCTADSSFGIQIPILSKQSQPIFDAIKALTCCQLSLFLPPRDVDILQSAEVTRRAIASVGSDVYSNSEEAVAACALLTISQLMPRVVIDWHPILKERTDSFASLSINGFWLGHRASVSWAILRLGSFSILSPLGC